MCSTLPLETCNRRLIARIRVSLSGFSEAETFLYGESINEVKNWEAKEPR